MVCFVRYPALLKAWYRRSRSAGSGTDGGFQECQNPITSRTTHLDRIGTEKSPGSDIGIDSVLEIRRSVHHPERSCQIDWNSRSLSEGDHNG